MTPRQAVTGVDGFVERHGVKLLLAVLGFMLITRENTTNNSTDIAVMATRLELELRPIKEDLTEIKERIGALERGALP